MRLIHFFQKIAISTSVLMLAANSWANTTDVIDSVYIGAQVISYQTDSEANKQLSHEVLNSQILSDKKLNHLLDSAIKSGVANYSYQGGTLSGQWGGLAPTAHRTVRTDPYTAPHVKHTSMLS